MSKNINKYIPSTAIAQELSEIFANDLKKSIAIIAKKRDTELHQLEQNLKIPI